MQVLTLTPYQLSQLLDGHPQQLVSNKNKPVQLHASQLTGLQKNQLIQQGQTQTKDFWLTVRSASIVPVANALAVKNRPAAAATAVSALPRRQQAALEPSTNTVVYLSVDFENMPEQADQSLLELSKRVHQLAQSVETLQNQGWTVTSDGQGGWQAQCRCESLQQARDKTADFEGTSFQMFYRGRPI